MVRYISKAERKATKLDTTCVCAMLEEKTAPILPHHFTHISADCGKYAICISLSLMLHLFCKVFLIIIVDSTYNTTFTH